MQIELTYFLCSLFWYIPGPRYRRPKQPKDKTNDEKRPRTAFSSEQLARLKVRFFSIDHLTILKELETLELLISTDMSCL